MPDELKRDHISILTVLIDIYCRFNNASMTPQTPSRWEKHEKVQVDLPEALANVVQVAVIMRKGV